ncbi:MAG: signal peptidase I [Dehalococcoidia bacterium]|nr:signal peptidase I [Dehalococcoidia bacterium]
MKFLREIVITVLIAIVIYAILRFTVQGYVVKYSCMLPNIESNEWIMVNKVSYAFSEPQRGDVIVLNPPIETEHPFIKRVIGLPGETVEVKEGKVFINGTPLTEEYILEPIRYTMPSRTVPEGEYFVMGDNRNSANDSHTGWTVPREDIIGKAMFVYWPLGKLGIVKHYHPQFGMDGEGVMICLPLGA